MHIEYNEKCKPKQKLLNKEISNLQGTIKHLSNTRLPVEDLEIKVEGTVGEVTDHQFATTMESEDIFRDSIQSPTFFVDIVEVQSMK